MSYKPFVATQAVQSPATDGTTRQVESSYASDKVQVPLVTRIYIASTLYSTVLQMHESFHVSLSTHKEMQVRCGTKAMYTQCMPGCVYCNLYAGTYLVTHLDLIGHWSTKRSPPLIYEVQTRFFCGSDLEVQITVAACIPRSKVGCDGVSLSEQTYQIYKSVHSNYTASASRFACQDCTTA